MRGEYLLKKTISLKSESLRDIRTITGSALLMAVAVIIDFFRIVFSNIMDISFSFLALALTGMLYGPLVGGVVGGISDIIQYIVRPSGPFFPGFTLSAIVGVVIYALFLYQKPIKWWRVVAATLLVTLIVNVLMNTYWIHLLYGLDLRAAFLQRILKELITPWIQIVVLYVILNAFQRVKIRR